MRLESYPIRKSPENAITLKTPAITGWCLVVDYNELFVRVSLKILWGS